MALEPRMGETGAPFDLHSIEQCSAALASAAQPHATLALIHRLGATLPGHCLFSVNAFRAQTMEVERLYSSNPQAYPVGGRKLKRDTGWSRKVLVDTEAAIVANILVNNRFRRHHRQERSKRLDGRASVG